MSKFRVTLLVDANEDMEKEDFISKLKSMLPYLNTYEDMNAEIEEVEEA